MYPKVSIIIPVYNGSNYLRKAIDSALAQTYKNLEIIVINDGSDDKGATENITKSYGNKIIYFNKKNGGVATALNLGIKKMTGEYFSWLSHDDMYSPDKIEKQIALLRFLNWQENIIVASNIKTLFENGLMKKEYINHSVFKYIDIFLATSSRPGLNGCSLLIPKKVLVDAGGFNVSLPFTQDYDMWFRLKDTCEFVLVKDHLVISRVHKEQDSARKHHLFREVIDSLHKNLLDQVSTSRFEKFLSDSRCNAKYIWKTYQMNKFRGLNKTSAKMLQFFLDYYYRFDRTSFYRIFNSEVGDGLLNRNSIEKNYKSLVYGDSVYATLRKVLTQHWKNSISETVKNNSISRLTNSIKSEGVFFTIRRIIRKIHSNFLAGN